MTRIYGVGVLGLGVIGRVIAADFAESPRFKIAAAFDPAGPGDAPYPMRDTAEEVAKEAEVDCLYVASPPGRHAEGVALAIAAHKPVLCEKPLAPSPSEADRLAADVRSAGLLAAVDFGFATLATGRAIADAVDRRVLGHPTGATLEVRIRQWPQPWQAGAGGWLTSPDQGGFTREVLTHFVALADRLFGPGTIRQADVTRGANGLETRTVATIDYGGLAFAVDAAMDPDLESDENMTSRFAVDCELGSMAIQDWVTPIDLPIRSTEPEGIVPAFARLLDGEHVDLPDFDSGARVVRLIEGILSSPPRG